MRMIKKLPIVVILSLAGIYLSGQANHNGIPYIKNYPPVTTLGSEQNWAVVQDHRGLIYVGNDDKGILEYDGVEWRTIDISNESSVRSLAVSDNGTVYVGAVSEIGCLEPDETGNLNYRSLMPLLDTAKHNFSNVWRTYYWEGNVYFCSQRYVMIFNEKEREFSVFNTYKHTLFSFLIDGSLYAGAYEDGLVVMEGDTIVPVDGGTYYSKKNIFGLVKFDEESFAIVTMRGGLSLFNPHTGHVDSTFFAPETNAYIGGAAASNLLKLTTGELLVSTQTGGLVVVDRSGKMREIITKDEGLQAQTVYFSYYDEGSSPYPPVWSALGSGVTKIGFNAPLKKFTEDLGFLGLVLTVHSVDGTVFIGTDAGLFRLENVDSRVRFEPVAGINSRVWSLEDHTTDSGDKILLALTDRGFMEITLDGKANFIEDDVINKRDRQNYRGYKIVHHPDDPNRLFIGRDNDIIYLRYENGRWYEDYKLIRLTSEVRFITFDNEGMMWFGTTLSGIGKIDPNDTLAKPRFYTTEDGLPSMNENVVTNAGNTFRIGTKDGIYLYDKTSDRIIRDENLNQFLPEGTNSVGRIYQDIDGDIWISFEHNDQDWMIVCLQPGENGYTPLYLPFYSLPNFETDAFHSFEEGKVWFSRSNLLYVFHKGLPVNDSTFRAHVRRVKIENDTIVFNGADPHRDRDGSFRISFRQEKEFIPSVKHADNNIEVRWSATYFDQEENVLYSYYLDGFSKSWSPWERVVYKDFTNLPHGTYTFRIKAKNIYNQVSIEDSYSFRILRPWYLSFYAFLGYIILAVLVIYIIIVLYTRRLKNENIRLEGIIQDRTAEIRKQKEELTDSIEYASRIQRALLPPTQMLSSNDLDHFILFKPRDIVSGDFYWFGVKDEMLFIVAADCTGHGVPGAFMSMLGISFLDEIVIKSGVTQTNTILDALRQHVITSLRQTGKSMDESTKDGMDLAMVAIDRKKRSIQFSGAYNPLYGVRKLSQEEKKKISSGQELELDRGAMYSDTHLLFQVKGDQMPIGISEKDHEFSAHTISYEDDLTIYLFSDGYVDQFGGPTGKKFMSKNFKKLLLDIQDRPLNKQREVLDQTLINWMADISQIDDILVIGIRLTS
jgi:serine phosphatase RsbU (regulator of sigma subunit)/ligand-binding sensor domain-containing protein